MAKPEAERPRPLRVRAARAICGTDGDTAIVVLKGTPGTVASGGVSGFPANGRRSAAYSIAVIWDFAVLNEDPDNPGVVSEDWEWDDVPADALEYAGPERETWDDQGDQGNRDQG